MGVRGVRHSNRRRYEDKQSLCHAIGNQFSILQVGRRRPPSSCSSNKHLSWTQFYLIFLIIVIITFYKKQYCYMEEWVAVIGHCWARMASAMPIDARKMTKTCMGRRHSSLDRADFYVLLIACGWNISSAIIQPSLHFTLPKNCVHNLFSAITVVNLPK